MWSTVVSRIISPHTPEAALNDHSEHNAKIFGSPKDRLDFYRREIQYETSILANRTDAYLTAQSFLVIAFVSGMGNLNPEWGKLFTLVVPIFLVSLGILSSLNAWPGIRAAYEIIDHWHYKQSELLRSEPVMGMAYDESPLFSEVESPQGLSQVVVVFHACAVVVHGVLAGVGHLCVLYPGGQSTALTTRTELQPWP